MHRICIASEVNKSDLERSDSLALNNLYTDMLTELLSEYIFALLQTFAFPVLRKPDSLLAAKSGLKGLWY